ncbi:hypothetical protein BABINDRAFT_40704 [Babjeviella inositovora NRRL Y-12698]|uniref:Cytidyltransferase-like domain-containing protein n=1 Tax=Babjeviella inositovora NRRL Y-12698 TaxID=984486 RepID=A0A1E3QJ98_9ASCO|nr:uncharacterized protein BABINDRAFT_40704 [Babjeviella inositovora NRRL Y-12698]ODQ77759.1 hypothetical protein BABINDRAFT_40704 [Babjeviella inositovora NRRL Y-12698]
MGNFDTVAVGGTFDHLHEGHKILLSQSLFLARKTLIVGVTGPKLLVNKKYAEELESYEDRVRIIREFVARLLPKSGDRIEALSVDIYMIEDICGPTGYLEDIDALVISAETRAGGKFVNDFRLKKGMHSLSIVEIGVITPGGTQNEDFSTKLSSTAIRQRIHLKRKEKK